MSLLFILIPGLYIIYIILVINLHYVKILYIIINNYSSINVYTSIRAREPGRLAKSQGYTGANLLGLAPYRLPTNLI